MGRNWRCNGAIMFPLIPYQGLNGFMDIIMFAIQNGRLNSAVHLFTNDFVPDVNTRKTDFVETNAGGMGGQALPIPTNIGVDVTGCDIWLFPQMVYTATGPNLPAVLYGFWVDCTDPITALTTLLWCQRFENAQAAIAVGNTVKFVPSLGMAQC